MEYSKQSVSARLRCDYGGFPVLFPAKGHRLNDFLPLLKRIQMQTPVQKLTMCIIMWKMRVLFCGCLGSIIKEMVERDRILFLI